MCDSTRPGAQGSDPEGPEDAEGSQTVRSACPLGWPRGIQTGCCVWCVSDKVAFELGAQSRRSVGSVQSLTA